MHAGTILQLDSPTEEPLESWSNDGSLPALVVDDTQATLDSSRYVQTGTAATRLEDDELVVDVTDTADDPKIHTDRVRTTRPVVTEFVADVIDSGLVVPASIAGDSELYPFPTDLFMSRTGCELTRYAIDVESLANEWRDDGVLSEVWMRGHRTDAGVEISWNTSDEDPRDAAADAAVGLGFKREFEGTIAHGVVYESGYVAVWRRWTPETFIEFLVEELVPFTTEFVPDDDQTDFSEFGGDGA